MSARGVPTWLNNALFAVGCVVLVGILAISAIAEVGPRAQAPPEASSVGDEPAPSVFQWAAIATNAERLAQEAHAGMVQLQAAQPGQEKRLDKLEEQIRDLRLQLAQATSSNYMLTRQVNAIELEKRERSR